MVDYSKPMSFIQQLQRTEMNAIVTVVGLVNDAGRKLGRSNLLYFQLVVLLEHAVGFPWVFLRFATLGLGLLVLSSEVYYRSKSRVGKLLCSPSYEGLCPNDLKLVNLHQRFREASHISGLAG